MWKWIIIFIASVLLAYFFQLNLIVFILLEIAGLVAGGLFKVNPVLAAGVALAAYAILPVLPLFIADMQAPTVNNANALTNGVVGVIFAELPSKILEKIAALIVGAFAGLIGFPGD